MKETSIKAEPKRVLIVEDHPVVRAGLKQLLLTEPELEVCGEAERVEEAIAMLDATRPDVALVDLALPGTNGMELIRHLKKYWVGVKIIVVSTYDESIYGPMAAEAGADCYINKHEAMDQIVKAIHAVLAKDRGNGFDGCKTAHWFG